MNNNKWCNPKDIKTLSRSCSPNLEHLTISCHSIFPGSSVWSSIQLSTSHHKWTPTLSDLHDVLCRHQTQHPDAAVVVVGDFNRANIKKVMPNFHQRSITCATRGERPLLYAIQERLEGCLSSLVRQVGPCHHFPAAGV